MGFFDDVKNSLTEKSQDLSKKAKDTTEIYRLNSANKSMEKEVEKLIYQIGLRYYANYKDECAEKCPDLIEQIDQLSIVEVCPNCGKKLDPNAKFCVNCGTAINREPTSATPNPSGKVCAACGTPLEDDAAFCTNCGTPVKND